MGVLVLTRAHVLTLRYPYFATYWSILNCPEILFTCTSFLVAAIFLRDLRVFLYFDALLTQFQIPENPDLPGNLLHSFGVRKKWRIDLLLIVMYVFTPWNIVHSFPRVRHTNSYLGRIHSPFRPSHDFSCNIRLVTSFHYIIEWF